MFGLPKETEIGTQLPKKAIFAKFDIKPEKRSSFDANISKITIVNELNVNRVAIEEGDNVKSIFVVTLTLKHKEYNDENIIFLAKSIPQKIVYALTFEGETKLAIYHKKLFTTSWKQTGDFLLTIKGVNLDKVWENFIISIGGITIRDDNTLDEQIVEDSEREKLIKQIIAIEKKARAEKQPARKLEMFEEIKRLKNILR